MSEKYVKLSELVDQYEYLGMIDIFNFLPSPDMFVNRMKQYTPTEIPEYQDLYKSANRNIEDLCKQISGLHAQIDKLKTEKDDCISKLEREIKTTKDKIEELTSKSKCAEPCCDQEKSNCEELTEDQIILGALVLAIMDTIKKNPKIKKKGDKNE